MMIKASRYLRKFAVPELDKKEAELVIKNNPSLFREIYHERYVNNIYFDTPDKKNYEDNVIGSNERVKYRIRWYGKLFGNIEKPVLELKIRRNELGAKMSFPLKQFKMDSKLTKSYLVKNVFSKSNLPEWVLENLKRQEFSILNRYQRTYFMSSDKKFRITLDCGLEFYNIDNRNNSFIEKNISKEGVIIELKYNREDDAIASRITNKFPFRLTKSSKYVTGVEFA